MKTASTSTSLSSLRVVNKRWKSIFYRLAHHVLFMISWPCCSLLVQLRQSHRLLATVYNERHEHKRVVDFLLYRLRSIYCRWWIKKGFSRYASKAININVCVYVCDDIGPKLTLFLFSFPFFFHRVRNWALKFGVDLWEFGRQFTKMNDIKTVSKSHLFVPLSFRM